MANSAIASITAQFLQIGLSHSLARRWTESCGRRSRGSLCRSQRETWKREQTQGTLWACLRDFTDRHSHHCIRDPCPSRICVRKHWPGRHLRVGRLRLALCADPGDDGPVRGRISQFGWCCILCQAGFWPILGIASVIAVSGSDNGGLAIHHPGRGCLPPEANRPQCRRPSACRVAHPTGWRLCPVRWRGTPSWSEAHRQLVGFVFW